MDTTKALGLVEQVLGCRYPYRPTFFEDTPSNRLAISNALHENQGSRIPYVRAVIDEAVIQLFMPHFNCSAQ